MGILPLGPLKVAAQGRGRYAARSTADELLDLIGAEWSRLWRGERESHHYVEDCRTCSDPRHLRGTHRLPAALWPAGPLQCSGTRPACPRALSGSRDPPRAGAEARGPDSDHPSVRGRPGPFRRCSFLLCAGCTRRRPVESLAAHQAGAVILVLRRPQVPRIGQACPKQGSRLHNNRASAPPVAQYRDGHGESRADGGVYYAGSALVRGHGLHAAGAGLGRSE